MNLPHSPRPPKWPYFLGDGILLTAAVLIGLLSPTPPSASALAFIFGCIASGIVLGVLPYLLDFMAAQREGEVALQHQLETQNTRLHQSAETLASIVSQLKAAHEATARAVHTAETLPYRLQEKIAEFTTALAEREDEEKAAMVKELDALRDAEGERLTAIAAIIQTATKDLAACEKQVVPALAGAAKLSREIEPALVSATSKGQQALTQAAVEIQATLASVESRVRQTIAAAENVDSRLADRAAALRHLEREIDSALQQKIVQLNAAVCAVETAAPRAARRVRHETAEPAEDPPGPPNSTVPAPTMQMTALPRMKRDPLSPPPQTTAAPSPADTEPSPPAATATATGEPEAAATGDSAPGAETPPKREPRRKPTTRSLGEAVLPGFAEPEIVYDDAPTATAIPAKTSDGCTRLLVTAYIGIGNKVFIRGDGPGLSREKGQPMEFVSIGKWSWETSDAVDPVTIQLFKNDDLPAQGEAITLPPGHHVEATPVFREPDPF